MNKREKIEFIRNKCIEVNSDVVKLSPQCKIKIKNEIYIIIRVEKEKRFHLRTSKKEFEYHLSFIKEKKSFGISSISLWESDINKKIDKIIGRPIRLADIIILLNNVFYGEISMEIEEMVFNAGNDFDWDLFNNDLEKQRRETINLIYNFVKTGGMK